MQENRNSPRLVKWLLIGAVLLMLLIFGGYWLLRNRVLEVPDFKPDPVKKRTELDLRPALIAKLQQLIKDGSEGLYRLDIDTLNPDMLDSKLQASGVRIRVDSAGYRLLAEQQKLPDDVFTIQLTSLELEGIGIQDLLHQKEVDVLSISILNPVISVHHKAWAYNAGKRAEHRHQTLYQRLMQQMDRISIGKVDILKGTFVSYPDAKTGKSSTFKNISIRLKDILIDSSTQWDNSRFLFAKNALLETRDYSLPSPDSLYDFRIGKLSVSGHQHMVTAEDVQLLPRGGKKAFISKLKTRSELFTVSFPKMILSGIEWWALVNGAGLKADKAELQDGKISIFLDKRFPKGPAGPMNNFPHQKLFKLPFPVSVQEVILERTNVSYTEFNPKSGADGTVRFSDLHARAEHLSNIPDEIRAHPVAVFKAKAAFMGRVPFDCTFRLDLAHQKSGAFSVDVTMGTVQKEDLNPFIAPMALMTLSSGTLEPGKVHLSGSNTGIRGKVSFPYTDLHMQPMKETEAGDLKEKKITGILVNVLLLKHNNPGRNGILRQPEVSVLRQSSNSFFNLIWTALKMGLLKTTGIPLSLGMKSS